MAAHSSKLETAIWRTSALDGEVAELHTDLGSSARAVSETSGDKSFRVIMDKMDCWGVTNSKEMTESTATAQSQIVHVTVSQNPEETDEVMKLVSQERVQQRPVEQVMYELVTMHV